MLKKNQFNIKLWRGLEFVITKMTNLLILTGNYSLYEGGRYCVY